MYEYTCKLILRGVGSLSAVSYRHVILRTGVVPLNADGVVMLASKIGCEEDFVDQHRDMLMKAFTQFFAWSRTTGKVSILKDCYGTYEPSDMRSRPHREKKARAVAFGGLAVEVLDPAYVIGHGMAFAESVSVDGPAYV